MPTKRRRPWKKPVLTVDQILAWADEYYRRHGTWPHAKAGRIAGAKNESWAGVAYGLQRGTRGLRSQFTLAQLLRRKRNVYSRRAALEPATIFEWAQSHHRRTGRWPSRQGRTIYDAPAESWKAIDDALVFGRRGLRPGSSLDKLLARHGVSRKPSFTPKKVLAWADSFFAVFGHWPQFNSGPIAGVPGLSWRSIDRALRLGIYGLKGKSSLTLFLNEDRGIFHGMKRRPYRVSEERRLDMQMIRAWSKAYRKRYRTWPHHDSGVIPGSGGLTWATLDAALRVGCRGLPGGSSLAKLFGDRRKRRRR